MQMHLRNTSSKYGFLLFILITIKIALFYLFTVGFIKFQSCLATLLWSSLLFLVFSTFFEKKRFVLYVIVSCMFVVDYLYFQNFGSLPSIKHLTLLSQLPKVGSSIKYFLNPVSLSFVADVPLVLILDRKILKQLCHEEKLSKTFPRLYAVLCFVFACFPIFLEDLKPMQVFNRYGLIAYHLHDPIYLLRRIPKESSIPLLTESRSSSPKHFAGIAKGKNVIVIQFEALQSMVIQRDYNGQPITPCLNNFLKDDSIYFSRYYQQTGSGNTADAEFVSLTSLHVPADHPAYEVYSDIELNALPRVLSEMGYYTVAIHGNNASFWNRDKVYPHLGFKDFVSLEDLLADEIVNMGLSDLSFYRQAIEILKQIPRPFFAFLITLSSHTPFILPNHLRTLELDANHENTLFGNYLQAINYADGAFGYFLELLKESGLYEESIVVVYGDHAGLYPFNREVRQLVSEWLGEDYDFLKALNVPLVVHVPGLGRSYQIDSVGGQIDFAPTLLNLIGVNEKPSSMIGEDLCNGGNFVALRYHLADGSFIDSSRFFAVSEDGVIQKSVAMNLKTNQRLPYYECLDGYKKAIKQIHISQDFLESLKSKRGGEDQTR